MMSSAVSSHPQSKLYRVFYVGEGYFAYVCMGIEERKNREEIDEQNQSGANEFPGTYHEKAWT